MQATITKFVIIFAISKIALIGNRVVKSLDCREANNSRLLFRSLSLNLFLALQPS